MKKYIIIVIILAGGFYFKNSVCFKQSISDLTLSNIEALANGETDENGNPISKSCVHVISEGWPDKNFETIYCEPVGDNKYSCRRLMARDVSRWGECYD